MNYVLSISEFVIKLPFFFFSLAKTKPEEKNQTPCRNAHQLHISTSTLQKAGAVNRNLGAIIY